MKQIARHAAAPFLAAVLFAGWCSMNRAGIELDEVPTRGESFVTTPYALVIALGLAVALAVSKALPVQALALAGLLLVAQLLFWPARFSQDSWSAYALLLPLTAIVSRSLPARLRHRALAGVHAGALAGALAGVLLGAAAVSALLTVPSLSMKGSEGTIYGKPWSVQPAVTENIFVLLVVCVGLAYGAWVVGRRHSPTDGTERGVPEARVDSPAPPAAANVADSAFAGLTPREQETFLLVARGHSNAEIAQRLFVTEATVKTHVGSLLAKLAQTSRSGLIAYAYDRGIVRPSVTPAS